MTAPTQENGHENRQLHLTTIRAVRHALAAVGAAHRIENPHDGDLFWLKLASGQLQTAIALLECRGKNS